MAVKLGNYVMGGWALGTGEGRPLFDAVTGETIGLTDTSGIDFGEVLDYARRVGNPALRKMTFPERGRMLKALAMHLLSQKETFYELSYRTGATRTDSWIDIEGGIGNLFSYASLRRQFSDSPFHVEGDAIPLSKGGSFVGRHIMVPKEGVAIHINAFNFPVWGMLEKIAVNLLAGVPAVVKPASLTSYLTEAVVREIDASNILPKGALQLICGSGNGLLDHVINQDVVTFTGSAETGRMLKAHDRIMQESVPFNMEADSLNCAVLGEDAEPGSAVFKLFIKEVRKEMTVKCGQKCTAIRRVIVPGKYLDAVQEALAAELDRTTIGNPRHEKVRMGALAGLTQVQEVLDRVNELAQHTSLVYGNPDSVEVIDADAKAGAFLSPMILRNET
ncbi:MAG: 3,4-dehydroadipyl-CoA semialdehyde dehydrogenase, partial [Rhodothermales bacterium]